MDKFLKLGFIGALILVLMACGGGGNNGSTGSLQTKAIAYIASYAQTGGEAPMVKHYADAGVIGVDTDNLVKINKAIAVLTHDDVDTQSEIQFVINNIGVDTKPPVFSSNATVSVRENQRSAITLKATDSSAVTYSISDADSDDFSVNSNTGVVIFKTLPDYEVKTNYRFRAVAKDVAGNETIQNITIIIIDIDDTPPVFTSSNTFLIDEHLPEAVITLKATDTNEVTYDINSSNFLIDGKTGVVRPRWILNYETRPSYTFTVFARDALGNKSSQVITVNLVDKVTKVGYWGGKYKDVISEGDYAFATTRHGFEVIDVRDKAKPHVVGKYTGNVATITVINDYVYIVSHNHLQIVDVSIKSIPTLLGGIALEKYFYSKIEVEGNYAYVSNNNNLQVVDISNKHKLNLLGYFEVEPNRFSSSIKIKNDYIFWITQNNDKGKLSIIDAREKLNLELVGNIEIGKYPHDLFIEEKYAYIVNNENGIEIVDVSDKINPTIVGGLATKGHAYDVSIKNNYAFVADTVEGMIVIDISDKSNPLLVTKIRLDFVSVVDVKADYAYVINSGSLQIIDVNNINTLRLAGKILKGHSYDVWVSGDYAYLTDITGKKRYLKVFDISNPSDPILKANHVLGASGIPMKVTINGDYAYIANGHDGLQIVNISDKSNLRNIGKIDNSEIDFVRDVAVKENYAYLATSSGLKIIDVKNKKNPVFISKFAKVSSNASYHSVTIKENHAFVTDGGNLFIVDISDVINPSSVANFKIYGFSKAVKVQGNYVYLVGDKGLEIIDVFDITNPTLTSTLKMTGTASDISIGTTYITVTVSGSIEGGLKVINIDDKSKPRISGGYGKNMRNVYMSNGYAYITNTDGDIVVLQLDF